MQVHGYFLTPSQHKLYITTGSTPPPESDYLAAPALSYAQWLDKQNELRSQRTSVGIVVDKVSQRERDR